MIKYPILIHVYLVNSDLKMNCLMYQLLFLEVFTMINNTLKVLKSRYNLLIFKLFRSNTLITYTLNCYNLSLGYDEIYWNLFFNL